ncbi:uncharacterized protein V6R79_012326 [Siganus canaliculatus]
MATKRLSEDMEEVKKSLNFMSEELSKVVKQQVGLLDLIEEIRQLKIVIKEKDKKIEELERRVEDLEQNTRMDDLVISGLETNHYSYARITEGDKEGEDAPRDEKLLLEQQVIKFFNDKDIPLDSKHIAACYTIPQKQNKRPTIIIKLVSRKQKIEVLKFAKKLKGTGVYVNEHLTKRNAEIARQARLLKKEKRIQDTWTRNCKVFIRLNGTPEQAKVIAVRDIKDLERYK